MVKLEETRSRNEEDEEEESGEVGEVLAVGRDKLVYDGKFPRSPR
jgi:hypothetical protein